MTVGSIGVDEGVAKKLDTFVVTTSEGSVHREAVVLTDPTTAANAVTVSAAGALKVDGSAATQPVSGTFYQATQPVSVAASVAVTGPLTDAQLRALAVPVSGSFFQATQPVSGTVAVSNFPATQPVSGSVTVSNFPATQPISAAALPLPAGAATDALQTSGNASLTTLAAKDFSTETTLAALKALLNITPGASNVGINGPMVQGLVDDNLSSYLDATIRPLSITNDGRLRVVNVPALANISFFDEVDTPPLTDNPKFIASPWASQIW